MRLICCSLSLSWTMTRRYGRRIFIYTLVEQWHWLLSPLHPHVGRGFCCSLIALPFSQTQLRPSIIYRSPYVFIMANHQYSLKHCSHSSNQTYDVNVIASGIPWSPNIVTSVVLCSLLSSQTLSAISGLVPCHFRRCRRCSFALSSSLYSCLRHPMV